MSSNPAPAPAQPRAEPLSATTVAAAPAEIDEPSRKPHVMVVEDDVLIREVLCDLLRDEGFAVEEAANGAQALQRLGQERVDLILLDLMMPVMDGWTFRREQQARPGLQRIPVILITATQGSEEIGTRLQASAVVLKPFGIDEIIDAVAGALAKGAVTASEGSG